MYGTTTQVAHAAGVTAIVTVFFAIEASWSPDWRFLQHRLCLGFRSSPAPYFCHGGAPGVGIKDTPI
jgi:hypothetical protein